MHVISRKKIREFLAKHPGADAAALDRWYRLAKRGEWSSFAELRIDFPAADQVGILVVFNAGGNKYRLIAEINYVTQKLFLRHVLTHSEYDRETWKGTR